jgi:hypothetical protein
VLVALLPVDDLRGPIRSASLRPLCPSGRFFDLLTPGLTPLRCVTMQAFVATQVVTGTYVGCYDLPKVGVTPQKRRDLGHATTVSGAPITMIDRDEGVFNAHIQQLQSYKRPAQGQVTRYKHVTGPGLPYMVYAAQPTLASFLLALGPLWGPPPTARSWLPHSHLYSSPRRFLVESHLLLGCSHKIPNGTSSAFDLPRCSTTTSNTILGLSLQGSSWHVLPHAAPGFFAGRECPGRWSSPNFASILLASRDDTSALHSGGRTQSQGETILSTEVVMVLSLDLASRRVLGVYL